MGLSDSHPEKEGILVDISDLANEIRRRLDQINRLEQLTQDASGLRVVDGMKGEDVRDSAAETPAAPAAADPVVVPGTDTAS